MRLYWTAARVLVRYDGEKLAQLFVSQSGGAARGSDDGHADRVLLAALLHALRVTALKDFATALRLVYTRLGASSTESGGPPPPRPSTATRDGAPMPSVSAFFHPTPAPPPTQDSDDSVAILLDPHSAVHQPPVQQEAEEVHGGSFIAAVPARKRDIIQYLMQGHFKRSLFDVAAVDTATATDAVCLDEATDGYYIQRVWREYINEDFFVLHGALKETLYALGALFQLLTLQYAAPATVAVAAVALSWQLATPAAGAADMERNRAALARVRATAAARGHHPTGRVPPLLLTWPQHMWAYCCGVLADLARDPARADRRRLTPDTDSRDHLSEVCSLDVDAEAPEALCSLSWDALSHLPPWWHTGAARAAQTPRLQLFPSAAALRAYRRALAFYDVLAPLSAEERGGGWPLSPLQRRQVKDRGFIDTLYREVMQEVQRLVRQRDQAPQRRRGAADGQPGQGPVTAAAVEAQTIDALLQRKGLLAESLLYFTPLYRYFSCVELLFPLLQSLKLYEEAICCLQLLLHTPVYVLSAATSRAEHAPASAAAPITFAFYYRPHKKGHYYHRWALNLVHLKQKARAFHLLKAFHEKCILPLFAGHPAAGAPGPPPATSAPAPPPGASAPSRRMAGADRRGEAFPSEAVQRAMHLYVQRVYDEEAAGAEASRGDPPPVGGGEDVPALGAAPRAAVEGPVAVHHHDYGYFLPSVELAGHVPQHPGVPLPRALLRVRRPRRAGEAPVTPRKALLQVDAHSAVLRLLLRLAVVQRRQPLPAPQQQRSGCRPSRGGGGGGGGVA
ncbi:hypothetical protein STCU_12112 [Strigomonas culicis]|uniref:Fanconi-associated nuclease n=1 Tax=Strigomonas culicis TaxID=28005 RepID=S9TED7_9TRYP|nr:hypothetical protein STCU_12112 [Strigomonas culicis]|eukprot:EPY15329.1 hypothetical protein STCU_12112 [Strigomonas culicis]